MIGDMHQMEFTINSAKKSKYINNVIVTTGDVGTATKAQMLGAECPFIRREALTKEYVPLEPVLMDVVENLEADGIIVDLVVSLEETFPFRDDNLIDEMIEHLLSEGFDTVIAAKDENGSLWKQDRNKGYIRLDSGDIPREYKENTYVGLKGLCCVTHPEFIRQDRLMGNNVGLFNVKSPLSSIEIRSNLDREIAKNLLIEYKLLQSK
jgi:N-acylneuraminate cytidylyltransferase